MSRVTVGLLCVTAGLIAGCSSGAHAAPFFTDPARWAITVPPGWHVVRFSDSKNGVRSEGIQLSNVRLPAPTLVPGSPIQVNGKVLPTRGVGLIIATDTDHGQSHGKLAVPPLPLPWPDGSHVRGWLIGSAPPRSPIDEWLWFRVNGKVYVAAVTMGWKASRAAERQLFPVVRSITSDPASS